jgi:CHAT domain-containing protein
LHWCPTGRFSSVPLHAAGIYDGAHRVSCADYVVSSYTPTVTALLRAQRAATPLRRDHLSLALVAEKRAQDTTLLTIPGVDEEIEHIAAAMDLSTVNAVHQQAGMTTVTGTSAMMQTANIVHLACHGIQDIGDATQSGFCLGDGRLTIAKLMELKLDEAFLAFLSACETAKGDKEQPDQAMHLAAAMLFSGFKSVIATMWYVHLLV